MIMTQFRHFQIDFNGIVPEFREIFSEPLEFCTKFANFKIIRDSAEMVGWYAEIDPLHGSTGAISTAQVVALICLQQCGEIF